MKVFNAFLKVLKKHIVSGLIYIIVFLIISVALAKNEDKTMEFKESRLDIAVFDEDGTDESKKLIDYIGEKHDLTDIKDDPDTILALLYYEQVNAVIIIKKGYAENLAAGKTDDLFGSYHVHDSFSDVFVKNMLNEYVTTASAYAASGSTLSEALDKTEEALKTDTEVKYISSGEGTAEYTSHFSQYFQYMPYILLAAIISSLSPVLIVMEKKEIRQRTACSGVSPASRLLQMYLGAAVFVFAIWLVFMAVGVFLNGSMYEGRAWLAVLNSFVFTMVAAGIAIFAASFGLKDQALSLVTQLVSLGQSFLCGVFVPQSMLGDGVLTIAKVLPAYWYVRANESLVGADVPYSLSEVFMCIGVQAGFAAALFAGTLIVSKKRRC